MLAWGGSPTPYKPAWRAAACPSRRSQPAARLRHLCLIFQLVTNNTKRGGCCLENHEPAFTVLNGAMRRSARGIKLGKRVRAAATLKPRAAPSPIAATTRLRRTSPMANTPGKLVSGGRAARWPALALWRMPTAADARGAGSRHCDPARWHGGGRQTGFRGCAAAAATGRGQRGARLPTLIAAGDGSRAAGLSGRDVRYGWRKM
jgi:hypothetical protein